MKLPNADCSQACIISSIFSCCRLCVEHLKEVKGLTKFCEWIKARGYKRAAVTNAERESAELFIEIAGLTDFFQAVIIGNECERPKPFPDPYLKALEVLGASADNTIIFEVFNYQGVFLLFCIYTGVN